MVFPFRFGKFNPYQTQLQIRTDNPNPVLASSIWNTDNKKI